MPSSQGPVPPLVPSERPGPEGGARDRNRRHRTQALLDAALGLFLAEGVEAVTIDAIARAAGVAKGSFYRYFKDKEQLVEALVEPLVAAITRGFDRCREALASTADDPALLQAYGELATTLTGAIAAQPGVARLYLLESRGAARGARAPLVRLSALVAAGAIDLTECAQRRGRLRAADPRVGGLAVVGAAERLLAAHLDGALAGLEGPDVASALIGLVLRGIRAP